MKTNRTYIIPLNQFSILWSKGEFAGTENQPSCTWNVWGGRGVVEKTTASPECVITYAVSRNQFLMDSKMVLKEKIKPRLVYKFFQSFGIILIGILKCGENVQIQ